MADQLSRRMSVQAAIAAGLLVAGLLLIARPSSQSAVVTTQFETVAHSKLSKFDIEAVTSISYVEANNSFLPQPCNYGLNITGTSSLTLSGLCHGLADVTSAPRCCTYNPIPADTTGCSTACAQLYVSFYCFSACNTNNPANASCQESLIPLYQSCNTKGCNVLGASTTGTGSTDGFQQWLHNNGITSLPQALNPSCKNFTTVDIVPCGQSTAPTFPTTTQVLAHFLDTTVGAGGYVYPGTTVTITKPEQFGVHFNVNNNNNNNNGASGSCTSGTTPVKALITVTLTPSDDPTTSVLLGNFTVWSPEFTPNGTLFEVDTTDPEPTADLVQIDPTTGPGTITISVTVYNFQGPSATNVTTFTVALSANLLCANTRCGPNLVIPHGFTYSPDNKVNSTYVANLTLLGDNVIDGRGYSKPLFVGQISFPDNTTDQDSVTFKDIDVSAVNITFGAGGKANTIYLIDSKLMITGGMVSKYATSTDGAPLCICGDANSEFILESGATFQINTHTGSTTPSNLVFCGQIKATVEQGATITITQTGFTPSPSTSSPEGIGIIDGASLTNEGTINLNDGILVMYTTGTFVNNGTIQATPSTQTGTGYNSIYLISGTFNESIGEMSNTVNRTSGTRAQFETILDPFLTCDPDLTIVQVVIIELCGINTTNVTVGSNTVAVVGEGEDCDAGTTYNGTKVLAEVFNLHVLNGGVVRFDNIGVDSGVLEVLGIAKWDAGSKVAYTLQTTINSEEIFIPLIICVNTENTADCCSPPPAQNSTVQQNSITTSLQCLSFGQPGYPNGTNTTARKFGTQAVTHPAMLGVVISKYIPPPPSQVSPARYQSLNSYCVELNENPGQFPSSTFLTDVSNTLGIGSSFVNINSYATDPATGYLRVLYTCSDYSSSAQADVTCQRIHDQALASGSTFNVQVQGIQDCGISSNGGNNKDKSNNALFGLFALAAIPLLICFLVILLCLNKRRQADNQYMQDTATFSNVASSPQNVAYAAPADKYYPSYPTPTPIGYYP